MRLGWVTAITLLGSTLATAGTFYKRGSEGGCGGGSVVCFSIPAEAAVGWNGLMTPVGRNQITSVEVYDLFKAGSTPGSNLYQELTKLDFSSGVSKLENVFDSIPVFRKRLEEARTTLGLVPDGFPAPDGVVRIDDAGPNVGLPPNCALVQTVARDVDQLTFDPTLWSALPDHQKAILQLHEELYFVGTRVAQRDSTGAQLLIIALLMRDQNPETLRARLKQYGFGTYSTLEEIKRGKTTLLSAYAFAVPRFKTWATHLDPHIQPLPEAIQACKELTSFSSQFLASASGMPEMYLPPLDVFYNQLVKGLSDAKECSGLLASIYWPDLFEKQDQLSKLTF